MIWILNNLPLYRTLYLIGYAFKRVWHQEKHFTSYKDGRRTTKLCLHASARLYHLAIKPSHLPSFQLLTRFANRLVVIRHRFIPAVNPLFTDNIFLLHEMSSVRLNPNQNKSRISNWFQVSIGVILCRKGFLPEVIWEWSTNSPTFNSDTDTQLVNLRALAFLCKRLCIHAWLQ